MDIAITGRNLELDDNIKRYVGKRLNKAERLYRRVYRSEVVLDQEKDRFNVEIVVHLKNNQLVAKESAGDLFAAIDLAADKVMKRLRRLRGKVQAKRRKAVMRNILNPVSGMSVRLGDEAPTDPEGRIVSVNSFADKPMLPEEARIEVQARGLDFIMFRNADTQEANLLYRRKGGDYGLIEPRF